jgi:hypothetical protein
MKKSRRAQPPLKVVAGQPSWRVASRSVEAFVTRLGGHLGPVTFDRGGRKIRPFSIAPWAEEPPDRSLPAIIRALRGDFFCLPFGANEAPLGGERHPVHGETANARWKLESLERAPGRSSLHLSLRTRIRTGRVDKTITVADGENAVYSRHLVTGMSGRMSFGHHAMLRFPDHPESGIISTSPFVHGQVFPGRFERPEQGGYSTLLAGAEFSSLERVPDVYGGTTDVTRYPSRRGFEDLVMVVADGRRPFAWTAVAFPRERFVWFSLKDPEVLRSTILWISNGGRHYAPWSGRHVNVMGLEEVTANFHYGLAESARANPLSRRGYPTCASLRAGFPLDVRTIMAVVPIPPGFDRVASIEAEGPTSVRLTAASGPGVSARVDLGFLMGSEIAA